MGVMARKRAGSEQQILIPVGLPRASISQAIPITQATFPSPLPQSAWAMQAAESTLCSQSYTRLSKHTLFPSGKPEEGQTKGFFTFQVCAVSTTAIDETRTGPSLSLYPKHTTAEALPVPVQLHLLFLCKQCPQLPIQPVTSNTGFS